MARTGTDPKIRAEWEELSNELHLLANTVARLSGKDGQIDVV